MRFIILLTALLTFLGVTVGQSADAASSAGARRTNVAAQAGASGTNRAARAQRQIVLGPDDKAAFAAAPIGFDQKREGIARGRMELVTYPSKSVGTNRQMMVYTPPGFSKETRYPVLYLLHGIGGDEREWQRGGAPDVVLDNLIAESKATPMIVVMPNGRAQVNDRAAGNVFQSAPAFAKFEDDLLKDVIPFIEANYPVKKEREGRALAGLSMGGGQSLNFGLAHIDTFAWVGGFSSAPNTKVPEQLLPKVEEAKKLKLLWISCGDQDGLINVAQRTHAYLKSNNVPHVYHIEPGRHDFKVWKNDLHLFAQQLFR